MIIDNTNGRLDEIKAFAKENNLLENFNNTISSPESHLVKVLFIPFPGNLFPLKWVFPLRTLSDLIYMM